MIREKKNVKSIIYLSGSIIGIVLLTFLLALTSNTDNNVNESKINQIQDNLTAEVEENNTNNELIESASSAIGKTVEEMSNTVNEQESNIEEVETVVEETRETEQNEEEKEEVVKEEVVKEITFIKPVEGEVLREFAKDNLVYSETLKEWITHLGIDIKADKTSIVKASAAGIVQSIKNDPRYGLTVTVEHDDGFKTIYSNLLTAEFVVEGEELEQGQTIGTVGTTSTFEYLDEPHLHFEIMKDNENIDPNIYVKY